MDTKSIKSLVLRPPQYFAHITGHEKKSIGVKLFFFDKN